VQHPGEAPDDDEIDVSVAEPINQAIELRHGAGDLPVPFQA
jgi:hypothetical protein